MGTDQLGYKERNLNLAVTTRLRFRTFALSWRGWVALAVAIAATVMSLVTIFGVSLSLALFVVPATISVVLRLLDRVRTLSGVVHLGVPDDAEALDDLVASLREAGIAAAPFEERYDVEGDVLVVRGLAFREADRRVVEAFLDGRLGR